MVPLKVERFDYGEITALDHNHGHWRQYSRAGRSGACSTRG